jgi:hypothetical protein
MNLLDAIKGVTNKTSIKNNPISEKNNPWQIFNEGNSLPLPPTNL